MKKTPHFSHKRLLIYFLLIGSISILTLSRLYSATPSLTIVSVGNEPRGGAYNPSTNKGVVSNHNTNTVSIINATNFSITTVTVGSHPYGVAMNNSTNKAYIANEQSDTVSVLTLSTNTVSATIPVGANPRGIVVNSTTNVGVVANSKANTVSILNLSTNAVTATLTVGTDPEGVVINTANNSAYVTNYGSNTVSVINLANNTVAATINVGIGPMGIDINTTSSMIMVANLFSNTVSVINPSTNTVTATINVGLAPYGVAINSITGIAYVSSEYSDSVSVINMSTNIITATYAAGENPEGIAVVSSLNLLFVVNDKGNQVYIINLASPPTTTPSPTGTDPEGLVVDPSTNTAITANSKTNTLSVINLANSTVITTIPVGKGPQDVALNPNTRVLVTANSRDNTATIIDYPSRAVLATVNVGNRPKTVAIDPGLNIAAVANELDGTLSLINLATYTVTATLPAGSHPTDIAINPNTHIAIVANKKTDMITVINLQTQTTVTTISVGKDPVSVSINPNTNVAVVTNQKSNSVSIINLNTNTVTATISGILTPIGSDINLSTNIAAIISHEATTLTLIDLSTNMVSSTLSGTGPDPEDVAINPNTNIAVVTNETTLGVSLIQLPNPVPVLTTFSPSSAPAGGSSFTLLLNGSKFVTTSTITFSNLAISPQFISTTQMSATIPASAITTAGSATVNVINPTPGGGKSNSLIFTINPALPSIGSMTPSSATAGSASFQMILNGSLFASTSTVNFSGTTLTPVFVSSSQLNVTIPASSVAAAGIYPVKVVNAGGLNSNSLNFTVNNTVPTLTSLSPNSVTVGSSSVVVTLTGTNFVTTSTVNFSGTALTPQYVTTSQLKVTVPAANLTTGGVFPVTVSNPAPGGGMSGSQSFTVNNPVPALTTLSPNSAMAGSSNLLVTLTGTNFVTTSTVNFSGTSLTPQYVSTTQLNVTLPASSLTTAGNFTVTVTNPAPGGGTTATLTFTVNNPVPSLTNLNPASAPTGSGPFSVTLMGTNFVTTSMVNFSGTTLTPQFVSSSQLNVTIPASLLTEAGYFPLDVNNPAPGGGTSGSLTFTVNNLIPVAASLSPGTIIAGSSAFALTVNGSNFISTSTLNFSGQAITPSFVTSSQLTATIPANLITQASIRSVSITNPAPGGGNSGTLSFTINNPLPSLTSLSSASVIAGSPDLLLTLTGNNFVTTSTVNYSGQTLSPYFVSTSQLNVTIPAALISSAGIYPVGVVNPAPGGGSSLSLSFIVNNSAPLTSSISPTSVLIGSGDTLLTVNGTNFVTTSTIIFSGNPLATTYINSTQLTATIPSSNLASAGNNSVTVTNPAPGGGVSNGQTFSVANPLPVVTSISPGTILTGSGPLTLTLNGSNFVLTSTVIFDGQSYIPAANSPIQLVVIIPASAVAIAHSAQVMVVNPAPGGGSSGSNTLLINTPPVANAGSNQNSATQTVVTLDGGNSYDADPGDLISFNWSLISAPSGSGATIGNSASVSPAITPDLVGVYQIQLIVNDGKANSTPSTVIITAYSGNSPPNANAGLNQTTIIHQTVTLDGRKSTDPNNDKISYQWNLLSAPSGSSAALTDASSVVSLLTPDLAGIYQVQLVVTDSYGSTGGATVQITATSANAPPTANAGKNQNTLTGTKVTLDGTGSKDPNGYPLTYQWSFESVPAGNTTSLANSTTPSPNFTPDLSGDYLVKLIVNDGTSSSVPSTVLIRSASPNSGPNAVAGSDQLIYQTDTVTLDGTGSSDTDGDPLTYKWLFVSTPAGSQAALSNPTAAKPTFVADLNGAYVVRLFVSDGVNSSFADVVVVKTQALTSIAVTPVNPTITLGQTLAFSATGTFADSTTKILTNIVAWSSSNTAIATINSGGTATGLAGGSAQIMASYGAIVSPSQTLSVNNPAPTLISLTPSSAIAGSGSLSLNLVGSSFVPGTIINFGSQTLVTTFIDGAHLTGSVPASAISFPGTVSVSVTNSAPGGGTSNSISFNIIGPVINSISPTSGPIGTALTITGQNFDPSPSNNQVKINSSTAIIQSATTSQIKVLVPEGAASGPVFVTTPQGSATSPVPFTVTLSSDFTLNASPSSANAVQGQTTAYLLSAASSGSIPYTGVISLSVSGLPAGVSSLLGANQLSPGSPSVTLTVYTPSTLAAGSYPFTLTGTGQIDGQPVTHATNLTLQLLPSGTTTLSGRVLTSGDDTSLAGVTVTLGSAVSYTDAAGNFLLSNVPAGAQMVAIDGKTANTPGNFYPQVDIAVNVQANMGNNIGYIVYLPKLDIMHPVNLPVDSTGTTTQTVNATTPLIPNLTVTIPSGTKIIDPNGNPVSQITITPVPADRSPMPLPSGVEISQLFTIQPGGSVPSKPVPISFPNSNHADPGTRATLDYFDIVSGTWKSYGQGTVSANGKQIVPDAGVGIPRFAWHFTYTVTVVQQAPLNPNSCETPTLCHDPVEMSTGIFRLNHTDLAIGGKTPISLTRHYRSYSTDPGPFGPGTGMEDDYRLQFFTGNLINLVFPNGERSGFSLSSTGVFVNTQRPGYLAAILTQNGSQYTLRQTDGTVMVFTGSYLNTITDPNGNSITLNRNGSNRVIAITNDQGAKITFYYNSQGYVDMAVDSGSRSVSYNYDSKGNLIRFTDAVGNITRYEYNTANSQLFNPLAPTPDIPYRMTKIIDARNNPQVENFYGLDGRISQQIQADGGVLSYLWFGARSPVLAIYPPPFCPGARGQAILVVNTGVVPPGTTCVIYTPAPPVPTDRLVSQSIVIDPSGHSTTFRFNADGYLIETIDALGQKVKNNYSIGTNLLMSTTDAIGRTTGFTYDQNANRTSITDPNGNVTTLTYELIFNKTTSITDTMGNKTRFGYDTKGNLKSIIDPMNNTTAITYNTAGQPLTITDPLNHTTQFGYDAQGNLTTTTDPMGNVTRRVYDDLSRLILMVDPKGNASSFNYDHLNRITQILDAQQNKTQFAYDGNSNLLAVTDANNHILSYSYDSRNRVSNKTDPLLRQESYQYDQNDNLIQFTDRKFQPSTFAYDSLNRKTATTFADGSQITNSFDTAGRLTQITDTQSGSLMYGYDNLDRVNEEQTPQGTVAYQYDLIGRRISMSINGQTPVSYGYDADSRLTTIMALTQVYSLTYDADGRRKALAYPNGVTTTYSYDNNSRILGINHTSTTSTIENIAYSYDQNGLRTAMSRLNSATALPAAVTAAYDAANELTTSNNPAPNLTYDVNGNLTSDGTKTYSWNSRNQLVAISGGGITASFVYDAVGRRISKTINGIRTDYQYDGNDIVSEIGGGSAVNATYVRSLNIDEPFARITSTGVEYYHADALGSIFALTDAYGNTTASYTYDPFGNTTQTGISTNPFQYSGREADGTGLYYLRARYYSPSLQRFISEDPIGISGGINLYRYANNNPVRFLDPLGLYTREQIAAIVFNETRSLSGPGIEEARINLAIAVINGERFYEEGKINFIPHTAPDYIVGGTVPLGERKTYCAALRAADIGGIYLSEGYDPTNGAYYFNFRNGDSTRPHRLLGPVQTQVGPFTNSYPSQYLGSDNIYGLTYGTGEATPPY